MDKLTILQIVVVAVAVGGAKVAVNYVTSDEWILSQTMYECRYEPVRVAAVWRYGSIHPCSRFIDEYRWVESQGMGYFPDGAVACRAASQWSVRPLDCEGQGPPEPFQQAGGEFWNSLSGKEMRDAVRSQIDIIPGEMRTNYEPPRK